MKFFANYALHKAYPTKNSGKMLAHVFTAKQNGQNCPKRVPYYMNATLLQKKYRKHLPARTKFADLYITIISSRKNSAFAPL